MFSLAVSGLGKGAPVRGPVRRAASHPPLRPAGRSPCPPCAAAVPPPARPACGSPGNVAAGRRLRRLRPSQPPAVARGHPVRPQGQAPAGPLRGPCPRPAPRRLRRWCSGAARPPRCGGCGAVRPSGPVGGAPASLASPATPAAQAVPRGSAYALAARRSGPSGLALRGSARSRLAAPQALAPPAGGKLSPGLRRSFGSRRCGGPQFRPPRALAAQAPPPRAFARGGARGNAACGRECRPFPRPARPRQAPRRAASRPQAGALPAGAPASEGKTWRVSRPLAGSRPSLILVNGGAFMFAVACRISASGRVWWLVCRSGGVFGWSLSRPARSLWPSALAAASACQLAAESAPGCFWPAGAPVGRLAVVRCK